MNLESFLKGLKGNEIIYVGSRSSFLFVGSVDESENLIRMESRKKLSEMKYMYSYYNNAINHKLPSAIRRNSRLARAEIESDGKSKTSVAKIKKYNELVNTHHTTINNYKSRISTLNEMIGTWTPYLQREVVDVYRRKYVEPFGLVIIIEGREIGGYWFYEEYKNGSADYEKDEIMNLEEC